jgi:YVTN family beta-propeller protein
MAALYTIFRASSGFSSTPDGARAYVTNEASISVSVIDTASNTVAATVGVGFDPAGVAIHPEWNPSLRGE